jgi:hypothetical protein
VLRHPLALARLAVAHTTANQEANRRALATLRNDLAGELPATALAELIEVLQTEQARLIGVHRAVTLVEDALRGRRYVPRL